MIDSALLTYDLRVLCMEKGQLIACPLDGLADLSHVVFVRRYDDGWNLATSKPDQWWYDIETGRFDRYAPEGRLIIEGDKADNGICRLTGLDGYFHVKLTGAVEPSGALPHRRECMFRLLERDALDALRSVMQERWVIGRQRRLAKANSGESTIWDIHFGRLVVDFSHFVAAALQRERASRHELLFMAERNVYRARPYRPVIVYSLPKAEHLPELAISLRSLLECGRYQGEVCIASDLPAQHVEAYIPRALQGRYHLVRMHVRHKRDEQMPFLALLSSGVLDRYAPVVCLQSAVLVTRPVGTTLRRFAQGERIGAPVEAHFDVDERSDEGRYGGFLSHALPEHNQIEYGFSGSVLVCPSTRLLSTLLQESLRCSAAYLRDRRRPLQEGHEAGVLHYMTTLLDGFDPSLLKKNDFNPLDQAIPGKVDGTFLCCKEWLESHRAALMQSHLESLPRTSL